MALEQNILVEPYWQKQPTDLHDPSQGTSYRKVAYVVSRFPKLTETFILYEILALEKQGEQIELYPLLRARNTVIHPEGASIGSKLLERIALDQGPVTMHPDAEPLVERAHYEPFFSWPILCAHLHFMWRRPLTYFGTLWALLRATLGSMNYFVGALGIFLKTVYFARQMAAEGITHVHAHFANHPGAAAYIIHRLVDIPYSFTAHGADLQVDQHMLVEKVSDADFVVTISNYNKELIVAECGEPSRDKVHVVYCGVDTQTFQPCPEGNRPNVKQFTILCTGTMYEVKGHTYLIEACRLLNERGLEFTCHLIGDGPYRPLLTDQVAQAGLADRVVFQGQRTRSDIVEFLQAADVVSLPSIPTNSGRREGIPVVLMEAMASGVPVIASDISGIPELVVNGENGLLVPPCDPQALAAEIERLCNDSALRQRLGRAGRETILRDFDLHKNATVLAERFNREVRS